MNTRGVKKKPWLSPMIIVSIFSFCCWMRLLEGKCVPRMGCSRALAFYTVLEGDTLNELVTRYQTTIADVQIYNNIPRVDSIKHGDGAYILFPFPCECQGNLLGHSFTYQVQQDDTLATIEYFNEGLTRVAWIQEASNLDSKSIVYPGTDVKVPVNCSCGNSSISHDYGLFTTYAATSSDSVSSIATRFQLEEELLRQYNPSVNPSGNLSTWDIIFIPSKEFRTGLYPPYNFSDEGSSKTNHGLVIGLSVGGGVAVLLIILLLWSLFCIFFPRKRARKGMHHSLEEVDSGFSDERRSGLLNFSRNGAGGIAGTGHGGSAAFPDLTVDKSVEFSFEELAAGTNNFNVANKIGEGGYGSVYLANLRGQRLAVKRMNLQATREFLAEIQVLTHVHHTNLVQLIGYCTVDSLFLIYEYVENGTLDRHLHGSHNLPPLSWPARVQIALDAARGLEYIHEHTKPTYIHRDVKSSNILIDKQFHAKVADFGLTKLTESGIANQSLTIPTRLVGTFGYMSPEYARFGDVSPKVDVYSFGVVLLEIISAKEAIVRSTGNSTSGGPRKEEQRGLVTLFEDVLKDVNGREKLQRLVDPALGKNYPPEAAWKMAQLAGACTEENPARRPSMRTAVVALMTLSSTTQGWEMGGFGSDSVMTGWMSGR